MPRWCNYYKCSCNEVKEIKEVVKCHTDCEVCIFEAEVSVENGKILNVEQRTLLKFMGLKAKDYLFINKTSDNFKFIHRSTGKILDVRR
jgi:hypothetical protein